ncbi:MAG: DUF4132 domain-containing protein, partial [Hyphomicrobium sp.]
MAELGIEIEDLRNFRFTLLELGFPMDGELARLATQQVDNHGTSYSSSSQSSFISVYGKWSFLREIETAVAKGLVLDADTQEALSSLLRKLGEQKRPCTKGDEKQFVKNLLRLEHLTGNVKTVFDCQPAGRIEYPLAAIKDDEFRHLDGVLEKIAVLAIDIAEAYEPGASNWVTCPKAFERTFGKPDAPVFTFGWWLNEAQCSLISPYFTFKDFAFLRQGGAPLAGSGLTPEELQAIRNAPSSPRANYPYDWSGQALPEIDRFRIAGCGDNGRLLTRLREAKTSKPSPAWIKNVRKICDEFTDELVRKALLDWSELLLHLEVLNDGSREMVRARQIGELKEYFQGRQEPEPSAQTAARDAFTVLLFARYLSVSRQIIARNRDYGRFSIFTKKSRPSVENDYVIKGVMWTLSLWHDTDVIERLVAVAGSMLNKKDGEFRSLAAANACIWALGAIGTREAVFALGRIRRSLRDKSIDMEVAKAMKAAGAVIGLSLHDMEEVSVPDYGFDIDGSRRVMVGDVTLELHARSSTSVSVSAYGANGKRLRSVPKSVKESPEGKELLAEFNSAAKDCARLLKEARRRIEGMYRSNRSLAYGDWCERYLNHPLLGNFTRRIVWRMTDAAGNASRNVVFDGGRYINTAGGRVTEDLAGCWVRPWHPLDNDSEEVVAWRMTLTRLAVRQPFMQGWRPTYVVTDAERQTATYSNRFAGHILVQSIVIAMLRHWGWDANAHFPRVTGKPFTLRLDAFGVVAEFSASGFGGVFQLGDYGPEVMQYITTDRVSFYAIDRETGEVSRQPLLMDAVDRIGFCEVMRDIDLVVANASIGFGLNWQDRGSDPIPLAEAEAIDVYRNEYGTKSPTQLVEVRRDYLKLILPSLEIAERCRLDGMNLEVRGSIRTYKINLQSA